MTAILEQCMHTSIIEVDGRLQAPLNSGLGQSVQARLFRGERRILLDLSRVTEIDAAGVGELIRVFNATSAVGGVLRVTRANTRVHQLLKVAGLSTCLFTACPSSPSQFRFPTRLRSHRGA